MDSKGQKPRNNQKTTDQENTRIPPTDKKRSVLCYRFSPFLPEDQIKKEKRASIRDFQQQEQETAEPPVVSCWEGGFGSLNSRRSYLAHMPSQRSSFRSPSRDRGERQRVSWEDFPLIDVHALSFSRQKRHASTTS